MDFHRGTKFDAQSSQHVHAFHQQQAGSVDLLLFEGLRLAGEAFSNEPIVHVIHGPCAYIVGQAEIKTEKIIYLLLEESS